VVLVLGVLDAHAGFAAGAGGGCVRRALEVEKVLAIEVARLGELGAGALVAHQEVAGSIALFAVGNFVKQSGHGACPPWRGLLVVVGFFLA
jgi:hypothetical protein